ncbi:hypothetical protein [Moritella viscosa]|uniref:hypothetical protein n=1 Tax=Moritella viscosa TaxID=80854 RepID=UPI0009167BB7|nr:hypothetical protein [Moritella viscosa]SHO15965.1 Argininosuccinate lyase-Arginosuccinase [Moritella viscosa]SHO19175.1 Argininosuccinate lyase-Arginosuccinase [Moritella viscosa]
MTELISSKTALTAGKTVFNVLKSAYQTRQQERVNSFFRCVDTRYAHMTEDEQLKLNQTINSEDGRNVLANYVDAITQTSSDRVRMAIALLYCNDADLSFSDIDQRVFINGVIGITDHMVDFYLVAINQKIISGNYPYNRHVIHQYDLPSFPMNDIDGEVVYAYTNDLVRRRLLLPDPAVGILADESGWFVGFGSSRKSKQMALLLNKANEYLQISNIKGKEQNEVSR